jgi:hypothetical protein
MAAEQTKIRNSKMASISRLIKEMDKKDAEEIA